LIPAPGSPFSVDFILARLRSGVNVMSDMLVAILLDRTGGVTAENEDQSRV